MNTYLSKFKDNRDKITKIAMGTAVVALTYVIAVKRTQNGYKWVSTNSSNYPDHDDVINVNVMFKNGRGITVPTSIPKK